MRELKQETADCHSKRTTKLHGWSYIAVYGFFLLFIYIMPIGMFGIPICTESYAFVQITVQFQSWDEQVL